MLVMDPHKTIPINEALPEPQPNFQLADLLESRNVDWSWINKTLKSAPAVFEELLFRVHFKRNKRLPAESVSRILLFLSTDKAALFI